MVDFIFWNRSADHPWTIPKTIFKNNYLIFKSNYFIFFLIIVFFFPIKFFN